MTEDNDAFDTPAVPQGVGPQLRHARESKGLTIDQVAAETRISERHIEHIEAGEFDALPGRIYAIGFAKTVAKVVGLDQGDVAAMVRAEMGAGGDARALPSHFEPGDPARAPGRPLVWLSLAAVVLLLAGLYFASRQILAPAADLPTLVEQEEAARAAERAAQQADASDEDAPAAAQGPVVFTAQGPAWVRFYDAQGRILMEREMAEGESYTVPEDAEGPQLITGRPDLLAITIGGRDVPRLSEELVTLRDVPVDAEALLARSGADQLTEPLAEADDAPADAAPAPSGNTR